MLLLVCASALAAKPPSAAPPLLTLFHSTLATNCDFVYLPGSEFIFDDTQVNINMLDVTNSQRTILSAPTTGERKRLLLELLIRLAGLSLTPDDFIDATTGTFDCTNDKLLSLL